MIKLEYNKQEAAKIRPILFRSQKGRCAICGEFPSKRGRTTRLLIDHDHKNGKIRGLLCNPCNVGLGAFQDRVEMLLKAIEYLLTASPS